MTSKKSNSLPRFPSHPSGKRQMTESQEFEIMKLVLDKFLWLGFIMMAWGMYQSLTSNTFTAGIWFMISGAVLLLLFRLIIVREYEILGK
ncbi:hypothetical protein HYV86_02220 [Candidatus Woesearchaeota archaeon]|nr:hypothetical protein [Candidatus Woesearchaeota archaeon]